MITRRFVLLACGLAAAAASSSTVIPALRVLAERLGVGPDLAGLLVAFHVLGVVGGAPLIGRLGCGGRSPLNARAMTCTFLLVSAALNAAMAVSFGYGWIAGLRVADGVMHVGAIMCLLGIGATGDAGSRARRMTWLGIVLVVGVGAGIGAGGAAAAAMGPHGAFAASAGLAVVAAGLSWLSLPAVPIVPRENRSRGALDATALVAGVVMMCERFAIGAVSVALPFAIQTESEPAEIGRLLGAIIAASVLGMPLARLAARTWNARTVCRGAALVLGMSLASIGLPGMLGVGWAGLVGLSAGALFMGSLLMVSELTDSAARVRAAGFAHSAGSGGYLLGAAIGSAMLGAGSLGATPMVSIAVLGGGAALLALLASLLTRAAMITAR